MSLLFFLFWQLLAGYFLQPTHLRRQSVSFACKIVHRALQVCITKRPKVNESVICNVLDTVLYTYGRRAFPVAGPTVWNSLPDELRDPACDVDSFKQFLKQSCSALTSVTSALEVIFNVMRSINARFTYSLTYLITYLLPES